VLERLDPGSKTKRIAVNYESLANYLHGKGAINKNDREESGKAASLLGNDLQRVQRASWVLKQSDVARAFGAKVGNEFQPVNSEERRAILRLENGKDQTYEIVEKGHNFVLADKYDDDIGEHLISVD
jgi:hypothetical protein